MKIPANFDKCIICMDKRPGPSPEHIIPECIGGGIKALILCDDCNFSFGGELIKDLKNDPVIELAIDALKFRLPQLYAKFRIKNVAEMRHGKIFSKANKVGQVKVLPQEIEKVLTYDTSDASKHIKNILTKAGLDAQTINERLTTFEQAKNDEKVSLLKDRVAVKRSEQTDPHLALEGHLSLDGEFLSNGKLLPSRTIALIAYEFIGLLIGDLIYDSKFDSIRSFIRNGSKPQGLWVEAFRLDKYDTYHLLYPSASNDELVINIIFFGWLFYSVHFSWFSLDNKHFYYIKQDLEKKRVFCGTFN